MGNAVNSNFRQHKQRDARAFSRNMNSDTQSPPSKRGKRACTECRQQKARCDAYLNPQQPCTRCIKMKTECVISEPFRREHKRQRMSELQRETNELRQKLQSSLPVDTQSSPIAMLTAAAEMGVHVTNGGYATNGGNDLTPVPHSHLPVPHPQQLLPPLGLGSSIPRNQVPDGGRDSSRTDSRSLGHIHLTGDEIDEIFQLFFHHYTQFLPILDPYTTPNSYYAQSPFLFWAVIGVGSRTYAKNPTLLGAIARSIIEMALLSVISPSPAWHTIQALLLVITWPFPKDNEKLEVAFPLSGLLLHLAMQQGLHIPVSSHEFTKKKLPAPSEADIARRSELWAYCILTYQRSCAIKGQAPRSLMNLEQDISQRQVLFQKIAPSLVLQVKCEEIIARCGAAALEFGVRTMSPEQERAFDILLREFEDEVTDLSAHAVSVNDRYYTTTCRMNVQMFHFFKNHTLVSTGCLQKVLVTACNVIDIIQNMGQTLDTLAVSPVHMNFGLLLASITLLRILKGPKFRGLDIDRAKATFFTSINLAKQMSADKNDTCGRSVTVVNQLWNSPKSFRKPDGTEYITLRIRTRLALSPVVDALWWWRDEFDSSNRGAVQSQGSSDGVDYNRDNLGGSRTICSTFDGQELIHFDDQFLADFEWAIADDNPFPPTEPYGSIWSSGGRLA